MLELYQHDLSDVWDQDLDGNGEYGYELDEYWSDANSKAYIMLMDSHYAGFALVTERIKLPNGDHWLEQFFVVKKYRRQGLGMAAARTLFDLLPGRWQVGQMPLNLPAQAFWRTVIGRYTKAKYEQTQVTSGPWQGTLQEFTSPARSDA